MLARPAEPKLMVPGLALASATSSLRLVGAKEGLEYGTIGARPKRLMGSKSFTAS